ncbi:hypothetical protein [Stutzerimonas stutzeri]|uniref:hypothetical protein n=1 Tax=Stutzerimonas stutzeri TaxID=316 RepID=UPI001ED904F1|nr:hypothetical protein [Stutzerimonas stutzeri]
MLIRDEISIGNWPEFVDVCQCGTLTFHRKNEGQQPLKSWDSQHWKSMMNNLLSR